MFEVTPRTSLTKRFSCILITLLVFSNQFSRSLLVCRNRVFASIPLLSRRNQIYVYGASSQTTSCCNWAAMSSSPANSAQQLQNAPALKPPPGVRPNFVNPPSYESTIVALEGVFLALMLIALSVRVYVRTRITKSIGWDDCKRSVYPRLLGHMLTG